MMVSYGQLMLAGVLNGNICMHQATALIQGLFARTQIVPCYSPQVKAAEQLLQAV
jgi:hypothetical protein